MSNSKRALFCILLIFPAQFFAATQIRYSVSSALGMPYARFSGEKLVGGVMFDLSKSIEEHLKTPVEHVVLPRKRIDAAVLAGEIDLRCYVAPQFVDDPDQYVWSSGLFEMADVLFGTANVASPRSIDAIPDRSRVSAVLGYVYPSLDPFFASGRLKREDTTGQDNVHLKMTAGRTPYGLSDSLALDWYEKTTQPHGLSTWRLVISRRDFQCAVPKNGSIDAGVILRALETIKKNNQFPEMLRVYR